MEAATDTQGSASSRAIRARRNYLVGIGLLLIVVFLWTASNFVTQVSYVALAVKSKTQRVF
jgi:solute carrier family 35, member F5